MVQRLRELMGRMQTNLDARVAEHQRIKELPYLTESALAVVQARMGPSFQVGNDRTFRISQGPIDLAPATGRAIMRHGGRRGATTRSTAIGAAGELFAHVQGNRLSWYPVKEIHDMLRSPHRQRYTIEANLTNAMRVVQAGNREVWTEHQGVRNMLGLRRVLSLGRAASMASGQVEIAGALAIFKTPGDSELQQFAEAERDGFLAQAHHILVTLNGQHELARALAQEIHAIGRQRGLRKQVASLIKLANQEEPVDFLGSIPEYGRGLGQIFAAAARIANPPKR